MNNILGVGQRTDYDLHLVEDVGEEGPPERRKFLAVDAAEVLPALRVVENFPAHQLLLVADRGHAEDVPHFTFAVLALKLDSLLDDHVTADLDKRVAEILRFFELFGAELKVGLLVVPLTEEQITVTPWKAVSTFACQIWNGRILQEKRVLGIQNKLESLFHGL